MLCNDEEKMENGDPRETEMRFQCLFRYNVFRRDVLHVEKQNKNKKNFVKLYYTMMYNCNRQEAKTKRHYCYSYVGI